MNWMLSTLIALCVAMVVITATIIVGKVCGFNEVRVLAGWWGALAYTGTHKRLWLTA